MPHMLEVHASVVMREALGGRVGSSPGYLMLPPLDRMMRYMAPLV